MKQQLRYSFRFRLLVSFLAVSLIPLCLCSALLVQIASIHMNREIRSDMAERSDGMVAGLDALSQGFGEAAGQLQENPVVTQALREGRLDETQVYSALYEAVGKLRDVCLLHLYDLEGNPLYSSHSTSQARTLRTGWGILQAAEGSAAPCYQAESAGTDGVLLWGAAVLKDGQTPVGYLVMELGTGHFDRLFRENQDNQSEILILNRFWRPVYGTQPALLTDLAPQLRSQILEGVTPEGDGVNYLYNMTQHGPTGLILVLQQPQAFSQNTLRILTVVSACWAAVCIIISVMISIPLSRQISSPIGKLLSAFNRLEQDDLEVQIPLHRQDELGQLASGFNHMVTVLKTNREELVQNQKELNETKLRMLQAQLNPHFLGNTLDTMKWISKINHVPQLAVMSTDLADILRFCISGEELVPLYRELEILERYIEIQRIRLSDQFVFQVEVPEELLSQPVPKMMLQPIVENAILHGLTGVQRSRIQVKAQRWQEKFFRITVTDNGQGIPEEMIGKPYSRQMQPGKHHLGLYNVHMILKLHYAENAGLFLDRGPGGVGTAVTATIPLQPTQEENPCEKY